MGKKDILNKKYRQAADVLKAIAHPTRIKILEVLLQDEGCVRQLEACLKKRQANISQHLAVLRKAGLVDFTEEGKERCYFLKDTARVKKIFSCLRNY